MLPSDQEKRSWKKTEEKGQMIKRKKGGGGRGGGRGRGRGREEAWHPVTDKRREETPWRVRHAS